MREFDAIITIKVLKNMQLEVSNALGLFNIA